MTRGIKPFASEQRDLTLIYDPNYLRHDSEPQHLSFKDLGI